MNSSNQILICTICNNHFNQQNHIPRIIPDCGHTFCEKCILNNIINSNQVFMCPEDSQIVFTNRENINNFPKNISIIKMMQNTYSQKNDQYNQLQQKPYNQPEVVSQKTMHSIQSLSDKNLVANSSQDLRVQTVTTISKQSLAPKQQNIKQNTCSMHNKEQDLGCLNCQEKICSHCAIFGNHKGHTVMPEEEMKKKNKSGLDQMVAIKQKIQYTREDFIKKMEENFEQIICNQINNQKNSYKQTTRHKFQEFYKLLQYSEQKCYDQVERFCLQVEEKFKKFKNHDFKETYEKISNWNSMQKQFNLNFQTKYLILNLRVDQTRLQCENMDKSNKVNFDLFFHLEKLLVSGNELEIEYNNLLQFPIKLIDNYLDNISFQFNDIIQSQIDNFMSIQFIKDESDIIRKSIENLTLENQKDILSNSQLFQLTSFEIKTILGTTNQTPSQKFLQSHETLNHKQNNKINHANSKNHNSQESSRKNSSESRFKSNLKEQKNKSDVSLDHVDSVVAELGQYRQMNIVPQLKESSFNKDKMLLSYIDDQNEFLRNSIMFNSRITNGQEQNQYQSQVQFTQAESILHHNLDNSTGNGMSVLSSPYGQIQMQGIYDEIKTSENGFLKKSYPSVHDNCKYQAMLANEVYQNDVRKSSNMRKSQLSSDNNPITQRETIRDYQNQQKLFDSKSRLPYVSEIDISYNGDMHHYQIKSDRSHYTRNFDNSYRDNGSILKKSLTPQKKHSLNQTSDSQIMNKSLLNTNTQQNHDLSKTLSSDGIYEGNDISYTSAFGSNQNSSAKQSKKTLQQSKNNSIKFIKSPQKNNIGKQEQDKVSPINSSRKIQQLQYKKKSQKLQIIIQKLRMNEYIDTIELVNEDVNDKECEELGIEIARTKQIIDSIKLVKNKISDFGLKAILQGLEKSDSKIHTLNLTNNQCSENCFDDILKYLQKNSNLQNIYLLNNNIQIFKNKEKLKCIQQLCNIHI